MIISVGKKVDTRRALNFGTHNGIFHCDEVVAMAILEIAHMETKVHVVRTRVPEELKKLDIAVDIGGGMFDHHMAGFNACRKTGEKYASAGLVWRQFAEKAIKNVMAEEGISIDDDGIAKIKEQIDKKIIIPVDMEDNGESEGNSSHMFSFIPKYLPSWLKDPDYDEAFGRVEAMVCDILVEIVRNEIVQIVTEQELQKKCDSIKDEILQIPAQTMPWVEYVVDYNKAHNNKVKFVVFRYHAGGWAAQCVPPSMEEKFKQLVPFPKEWAGGNEETLPGISGIQEATFCHNGCFFARARTKYAIIEMCQVAMNKA